MSASSDTLLNAEEAATALLGEITLLREEVENYSTATSNLDEVRKTLSASSASLEGLTNRTAEVIEALASVGTPAIIEKLEALQDLHESTDCSLKALGDLLATLKEETSFIADWQRASQDAMSNAVEQLAIQVEAGVSEAAARNSTLVKLVFVAIGASLVAVTMSFPVVQGWISS